MAHESAPMNGLLSWLPILALAPLLFAQGVYVPARDTQVAGSTGRAVRRERRGPALRC